MSRGLPPAPPLPIIAPLEASLTRLIRKHNISKLSSTRIESILLSTLGVSISQVAQRVGIKRNTVKVNRRRWQVAYQDLKEQAALNIEGGLSESDLDCFVLSVLSDLPRSGRKKTITLAQESQIVALASEAPIDHGIPINNWTYAMLAKVAKAKNIVSTISAAHVGRILKKSAPPSS